jgi:hypothetical protein
MNQQIAVWNTGAHYSENGQRIAATVVEGGIVFLDMDRGIDGLIPLANTVRDLRAQAQHGYDYGNYVSAWEHSDVLKQLADAIEDEYDNPQAKCRNGKLIAKCTCC